MADVAEVITPELVVQRWMDFLGEEGFRPKREGPDEDGDHVIRVKVEGAKVSIGLLASDAAVVTFALYYRLPEPRPSLERLLVAAHNTTATIKAAKAIVDPDDGDVRFQFDLLLEDPLRFGKTFERVVRLLVAASDHFFEDLAEG